MAKINVALCITELDLGGAERCLTELALRVDRQRFTPVVYCLGPRPTREEASCLPALEQAGVEVHCLGGARCLAVPRCGRPAETTSDIPKAPNYPNILVSCQCARSDRRTPGGREGGAFRNPRGRTPITLASVARSADRGLGRSLRLREPVGCRVLGRPWRSSAAETCGYPQRHRSRTLSGPAAGRSFDVGHRGRIAAS